MDYRALAIVSLLLVSLLVGCNTKAIPSDAEGFTVDAKAVNNAMQQTIQKMPNMSPEQKEQIEQMQQRMNEVSQRGSSKSPAN